jgi:DNA polymerase III alpha subunit
MIRSGYSFKTAVGHLPEVLARVQDIGFPAAPLADRNSTFGFVRWSKLTAKVNIKPVYGVEIGVCPTLGEKKPVLDYWTFLAKDDLQPLHELLYTATKNPGKEPSLTYAQAFAANGVFKISGERVQLEHCQIQPDFFIGLSPATPKGLFNGAKEAGHQFLAMFNNYYTLKTDAEFYRIALGGRASNTQSYAQHILSDDEWRDALRRVASPEEKLIAILNRDEVLENCNAKLTKAQILVPEKPKTLYEMCRDGAEILSVDLNDPKYSDRLDRELNLIIAKKFEDYFYIVADLVQFAKAKMLVGPGRGSSCGSLVCYLLRITSIDPLPHGLLFERFIDVTRNDLPDIDIDFSDIRRHLVFSYAEKKYGHDRVARLGTVGMFKPRSALNEVGKALRIPKWQIEKIIDNMIVRSSGDSRANQQIEDTLNQTEVGREILAHTPEIMIAGRMENHPANASQHAAGLIISEKPVINYVAIDARTGGSMCDKRDAEELNILKIDALGLKQLSIFERVLDLIGKPLNWLETLPLEDVGAFEVLNKEQFSGIFQFDGRSARSLIKDIKIECFNDLVIMNALARPGPLGSGAARSWVKRRTGQEPVSYPHALLEPHLVETLGLVIYQEQVMTIGREVGGLSWADVTALRKAMSKSLGAEHFDQYGDRWKTQAIANGLSPDVAMTFWAELCKFGLYGFNKSHAMAYALMAYWCCYLKAHHPFEFAAATLDSESEPAKQIELLRELEDEGVSYVAIDKEHSTEKWVPVTRDDGSRVLVGPLTNVKGIGPAAVQAIMKARREGAEELPARYLKLLNAAKTPIDTLYPVKDRVASTVDLAEKKIVSKPVTVKSVQCGVTGDVMIIAAIIRIAPRNENEAINVAKRGGRVFEDGMTKSLNLFFKDDTDEIFCKIDRYKFEKLGLPVIERGRPGRAIYAVMGDCPADFRMLRVKHIRYLCDLDDVIEEATAA